MDAKILCIGDIHFPFENKSTLRRIVSQAGILRPTHIVQLGDLYDMYSFSGYPGKKQFILPRDEIVQGREAAMQFWLALQSAAPGAACYQLLGNHDDRVNKRMLEKCPELSHWLGPAAQSHFEFPGVISHRESRDELIIHVMGYPVLFMHGFRSKLGDHVRHNEICTVRAHDHQCGVVYFRHGKGVLWELDAGWCGLGVAAGMPPTSYTRQRRISRWTQGFGWIDSLGPRVVCLQK